MPARNERRLEVRITSEARQFDRGFKQAEQSTQSFQKQLQSANQNGVGRLNSSMDVLGSKLKGFAVAAGAAFSAQKIFEFAAGAVQAASDLEQAIGGTQAVFGDASKAIDDFAKASAEAAGLSEREFREATTSIGGQLKRMTGDVDFAADRSIILTQVAADLAATYGGTTAEAVAALGSAFRGEADPAERFNLNLKAGEVSAKALALGLAESTKEIDENARAQATIALILEQSADAQGQFAREADTAAGKQQRLNAQLEDMRAEIGEALLPVYIQFLDVSKELAPVLAEDIVPALASIADLVTLISEGLPIDFFTDGPIPTDIEDRAREAAKELGFFERALVTVGQAAARFTPAGREVADVVTDAYEAARLAETGWRNHDDALRRATSGYGELGDTVGGADEAMLNMARRGAAELIGAMEEIPPVIANAVGPLDGLVGDLLAAAEAAGNVYGLLRSAADPVFAAVSAWDAYREAVARANEDGTVTAQEELDLLKEKTDLRSALNELGSNYDEAMNALATATDTPIERIEELFEALGLIDGRTFTTTIETQFTSSGSRVPPSNTGIEFREHGGRVHPGRAYVVGERRAEVLQLDRGGSAGTVYPSVSDYLGSVLRGFEGITSSSGATTLHVSVDARGATDPEAVAYATRRVVRRELDTFDKGMPERRV